MSPLLKGVPGVRDTTWASLHWIQLSGSGKISQYSFSLKKAQFFQWKKSLKCIKIYCFAVTPACPTIMMLGVLTQ